jgi:oligopeptide/dipeptide ABC transporter ATP-binding protein
MFSARDYVRVGKVDSHHVTVAPESLSCRRTSEAPIVGVNNLSVVYWRHNEPTLAVDSLSFELSAGRTLAVVGESGSGKTAVCRAIIGMLPRSASLSGDIRIAGRTMTGLPNSAWEGIRGRVIAMVLQDPSRSLNPTRRVGEQIADAVTLHLGLRGQAARHEAELLMDLLKIDSARSRYRSYPHQLSGGMKQRIAIAIAIAARPRLLLADESTRALDPIAKSTTLRLLKDVQKDRGMSLFLVSHNLNSLQGFADDVMVMFGGRAVEAAAGQSLFSHPRMPYTRDLLRATPGPNMTRQGLLSSSMGEIHCAAPRSDGCRYFTRCESSREACGSKRPELTRIAVGHDVACWHPLGIEPSD